MTDLFGIKGAEPRRPGWYAVDSSNGFPLPGSDGPLSEAIAQELVDRYGGRLVRVDAPARVWEAPGIEAN
jgi:hypothetical protein